MERRRSEKLAVTEPDAGNAIHGLLLHTFYEVIERSADAITLGARVAAQPGWPVPLAAQIRYAVAAGGLTVTHTVQNIGADAVPFGVGVHPYIRAGDAATDDCTLHLAASMACPLQLGLPTGPARPGDVATHRLAGRELTTPSAAACRPPATPSARHRLLDPDGRGVELWAEPDFRWVQVFTPDDHPGRGRVVAVEPMTCPPDALNAGTDLITLAPGQSWTGSWASAPSRNGPTDGPVARALRGSRRPRYRRRGSGTHG